MNCCFTDLRNKEVINKLDGSRLGCVCDVEFDTLSGQVGVLVIFGRSKLFGTASEDVRVAWSDIEVIGEDTILVSYTAPQTYNRAKKKSSVEAFFK
ncbi:MAG: YlmC/YmxH family sporulation protein [Oscillospiraceae bacterium]|jgi:YlmC/YmxH family sporulation protein|nr:YlmC/YmxH family sporulation protein [Oscillospiraceae bacterium]